MKAYVKDSRNLLNIFGRTEATYDGKFDKSSIRSLDENKYYLGLSGNNYWIVGTAKVSFIENGVIVTRIKSEGYGVAFPVKCQATTTYTVSTNVDNNNFHIWLGYYTKDGEFIRNTAFRKATHTFTTPENCEWLTVCLVSDSGTVTFTRIMLNEGSTALPYKAFSSHAQIKVIDEKRHKNTTISEDFIIRQTANGLNIVDSLPATVEKIQGDTVKCSNLFDISKVTGIRSFGIDRDESEWFTHNEDKLKIGRSAYNSVVVLSGIEFYLDVGSYSLSFEVTNNEDFTVSIRNGLYLDEGKYPYTSLGIGYTECAANTTIKITRTFTATVAGKYYVSMQPSIVGDNANIYDCIFYNIQFNKGDTVLPYEPYYNELKHSYFEKIVSTGKNLFDALNYSAYLPKDMSYTREVGKISIIYTGDERTDIYIGNVTSFRSTQHYMRVEEGETYSFNFDCSFSDGVTGTPRICIRFFNDANDYLAYPLLDIRNNSFTFTVPTGTSKMFIRFGALLTEAMPATISFDRIMLCEGSTALPYEPYTTDYTATPISKNLIPFPYSTESQTINGVTFTINNNDGSIAVKGTAMAGTTLYLNKGWGANPIKFTNGCTYTLSGGKDGVSVNTRKNGTSWGTSSNGNASIITFDEGDTFETVGVWVANGTTVDTVIYPMLNEGDTALPYESYRSKAEIEGRNLFNPQEGKTNTSKYIYDIGSITNNSMAVGAGDTVKYVRVYNAGTYTIQCEVDTTSPSSENAGDMCRLLISAKATGFTYNTYYDAYFKDFKGSFTFKVDEDFTIGFAWTGVAGNVKTFKNIMFNRGSTAFPYKPYISNEFTISTSSVELGKWDYILPQTGEIVRKTNTFTLTGEEPFAGGTITDGGGWGGKDTVGFYTYFKKNTPSNDVTIQQPNPMGGRTTWICNKFICRSTAYGINLDGFMANGSYLAFRVKRSLLAEYGSDNSSTTANVTAFKAWLADMYAKGDPVIVSYEVLSDFVTTEKINCSKNYIAYNKGREMVEQGETDNSQWGAIPTIDTTYKEILNRGDRPVIERRIILGGK